MALLPRPRPGSRLRPRKAGAAASSFRFPLAPSLARSVQRGKQRPLRAPPHAPQGPTTARLLPREPRRPPAPPRQPGAARRRARRSRPAPAAPAPPPPRALAPARGPGTRGQRTVGPPAAPAFAPPPSRLARAPVGTSGSFAVSRVLATVPRPSLTLAAPALFLCRIPPESQNNWGRAGAKKETERAGRVGAVRGDGKRN